MVLARPGAGATNTVRRAFRRHESSCLRETDTESRALLDAGIALQQGYLFARPELETFREARDIFG